MSRYTTAESIRETRREAGLKKDRERKRRARKAKKLKTMLQTLKKPAVQKLALKNAHRAAVVYNPVSISALLSALAHRCDGAASGHFMTKLFATNDVKAKVVDLVIDYGIADVEAALARLRARIEATHGSFSGGKYTKMR